MKGESGFSLLEVVISTAVLALLSGFIIQMFIAALYLNQKAYNLDMCANTAAQALESMKGEQIPEGGLMITRYFDSQWRQIVPEHRETDEFTENKDLLLPGQVKFILNLTAAEDRAYESEEYKMFDFSGNYTIGSAKSKIYMLTAVIDELKSDSEQNEIVCISTRKYQ